MVGHIIPPEITSVQAGGGTATISGNTGMPGASYTVLTTTNVTLPATNWTALATSTFAGDGTFSFSDTTATNAARFYRVEEILP